MTPVYTQKGASRVLTKRTCRDHPTQIKFEINTQNRFDPLNPAAWKDIKTSRHQDIKTSRHPLNVIRPCSQDFMNICLVFRKLFHHASKL
jgi:hypothetical protein